MVAVDIFWYKNYIIYRYLIYSRLWVPTKVSVKGNRSPQTPQVQAQAGLCCLQENLCWLIWLNLDHTAGQNSFYGNILFYCILFSIHLWLKDFKKLFTQIVKIKHNLAFREAHKTRMKAESLAVYCVVYQLASPVCPLCDCETMWNCQLRYETFNVCRHPFALIALCNSGLFTHIHT